MINQDEINLLSILYKKWTSSVDVTKDHFWSRDPIALLIKETMTLSGKWRNRARGNPRKAYKAMKVAVAAKAVEEAARLAKIKADDDWWGPLPTPIKKN